MKPRVLVVDDSPESLDLLAAILRSAGIEDVISAPHLEEGLRLLHGSDSGHGSCDVVIMDLMMPGRDGIASCRAFKANPRFAEVPVLMITAAGDKNRLAEAFDAGAMDYITKPVNRTELIARVRSAARLREEYERRRARELELLELQKELRRANEQLREKAERDPLTGLFNRRAFEERLEREWRSASRYGAPISLLMCDVDCFKLFNDKYGHPAGDLCLGKVARALESGSKRAADFAARIGGEEFAIVLPATHPGAARDVGGRILAAVRALAIPHHASVVAEHVTMSCGLATIVPDGHSDWIELVRAADSALYEAKRSGRNRLVVSNAGQAEQPAPVVKAAFA